MQCVKVKVAPQALNAKTLKPKPKSPTLLSYRASYYDLSYIP